LNLQRELQLATDSLNRLLTASQTLEIEGAKRFAPWRLVSEIQAPRQPVNTLCKDISVAVLLGLAVGMIAALLFENLDQTYHNPDDLSKGTGKTILGTIPWETKLNAVVKGRIPMENIRFLAAFSVLYSNLFFLRQKQTCRSFVITSATSSDGKSTVSFFLALAAARLGQRVLLIDGDRYYPQGEKWQSFAEVFNAAPWFQTSGGGAINEEEAEFYSLGQNLSYFKTEDNAMNPDQLMSSHSLLNLLQKWQEQFDIILIDTPPVLGLSDSKLIASKTDGVLLVARLDKTSKDSLRLALKDLGMADLTVLGLVANGVKRSSSSYNYYYRNRYYGEKSATEITAVPESVVS
ncbi:MAG: AAA family ATPase, partial [Microcystaceae cyanobacterium]